MTELASLLQPDKGQAATALHLVDKKGFEAWLKAQPARVRQAVAGAGLQGRGLQLAILPGERREWSAVLGVANVDELSAWCLAKAAESLPEGTYRVAGRGPGAGGARLAARPVSVRPLPQGEEAPSRAARPADRRAGADRRDRRALAEATFLVRDLVNIPAGDLGPAELEDAALRARRRIRREGQRHPATMRSTKAIR